MGHVCSLIWTRNQIEMFLQNIYLWGSNAYDQEPQELSISSPSQGFILRGFLVWACVVGKWIRTKNTNWWVSKAHSFVMKFNFSWQWHLLSKKVTPWLIPDFLCLYCNHDQMTSRIKPQPKAGINVECEMLHPSFHWLFVWTVNTSKPEYSMKFSVPALIAINFYWTIISILQYGTLLTSVTCDIISTWGVTTHWTMKYQLFLWLPLLIQAGNFYGPLN